MLSWLLSFLEFFVVLLISPPSKYFLIAAIVFSIFPVAKGVRDKKINWRAFWFSWKIYIVIFFVIYSPLFLLMIGHVIYGGD